jgi:hypothetical protein
MLCRTTEVRGAIIAVGGSIMREEKRPDRNWKEYNEKLVQRGEILLAVESLKGWKEELKGMNSGKNGGPFLYPHSPIWFLGILRVVFSLPYRQLEGFGRGWGGFHPLSRLRHP